jgi:LysR family glycine cleavage system transcriptional activator
MNWHKIPSLSSLRAFEATARLKSFSKAARELNVTHAAIAQHVRNLESYFSEPLVTRQGRGMATTAKGYDFAESLKSGFSIIASGVEDLQTHSETRPINISLTPTFASNWLMPRMGNFWTKHPDITVNLSPNNQAVDLSTGEIDMAIRFGKGDWPELDVIPLVKDRFVVVASHGFMKDRTVTCLDEAHNLPWFLQNIMYEKRLLVENEGLDIDQAKVTMLETNELVLSAVKANAGLSLQPYALVEQAISDGSMQIICDLKDHGMGYYIVTKKGRETPPLRIFKKWLLRVAKET